MSKNVKPIPLSSDEDEDEPIYQPMKNRHPRVPKLTRNRSDSSSSNNSKLFYPIPQSSKKDNRKNSGYRAEKISTPLKSRHKSVKNKQQNEPKRCDEPGCEICHTMNQKKLSSDAPAGGEDESSNANRQHFQNSPSQSKSRMNDSKRIKPYFSKKLAQLDATMKIIAIKVDQKVWGEKYLEAEELQEVLVWLRKVHKRLKELLYQQEQNIDRNDYRAANREYEQTLKEAVDLKKIQFLLTPTEYNTLLSLRNP